MKEVDDWRQFPTYSKENLLCLAMFLFLSQESSRNALNAEVESYQKQDCELKAFKRITEKIKRFSPVYLFAFCLMVYMPTIRVLIFAKNMNVNILYHSRMAIWLSCSEP